MSDFHQTGLVTTLHRLGRPSLDRLESQLKHYSRERPIALVLPCLHTEIEGPALAGITDVLRRVPYLHEVIVSVSGTADPAEFQAVRKFFESVPEAVCVWGSI